jgi:hypothetical protein
LRPAPWPIHNQGNCSRTVRPGRSSGARDTRGVTLDGSDSQQVYLPLPGDRLQDYPARRTDSDPGLTIGAMEPVIAAGSRLTATASTLRPCFAAPMRSSPRAFQWRLPQHQPVWVAACVEGDLQHRQLRRRPSHARSRDPHGDRRSKEQFTGLDAPGKSPSRCLC